MYEETTVGVVVPAYNEEGLVGEVIETVPPFVDRVYVVDDASTDDTWEEIRDAAERADDVDPGDADPDGADPDEAFDDRVVPVRHEENRGVGGAIKTGYFRALHDEIGVTVVMGGDGQMDPAEMEKLIAPVVAGEADYVKGNRLLSAEDREEMPGLRYVGNTILSYLTRIASGYWSIGDPQNGYTAIGYDALAGVGIEEMFEFYGYCNDLIVRLSSQGYRVVDVPVSARYRDEESHIEYRTYVPLVSLMLLRSFLRRIAVRRKPVAEAARLGLYLAGAGVAFAGGVGTLRRGAGRVRSRNGGDRDGHGGGRRNGETDDPDHASPSRRTAGPVTLVWGVIALCCAMIVDAAINRESNGRLIER